MSKTNNMRGRDIRWQLLVTVSTAALLASAYGAEAADSDRPLIWIELGGQLERLSDAQEAFDPPFMPSVTIPAQLSALNIQQPPAYALSENGKISFQPEGTNWVFSVAVQYGRTSANRHRHQQTANVGIPAHITIGGQYLNLGTKYPSLDRKFSDGKTSQSEHHLVLDFQAGKDVGLGIFGNRGSSVLSAGVRIAQFSSKENINLSARPDLQYPTTPISSIPGFLAFENTPMDFHHYLGVLNSQRSFRGVGPSLAWNGSMPFAGDASSGEITLDWGANAAVLFGRQRTSGHHQTAVKSYHQTQWQANGAYGCELCLQPGQKQLVHGYFINRYAQHYGYVSAPAAHHTNVASFNRTRSVTVPNFGGFAGLSYRYQDAKISFGYRADFFFGAIDGGIDARKSENRGFFGPYASISVGLGD